MPHGRKKLGCAADHGKCESRLVWTEVGKKQRLGYTELWAVVRITCLWSVTVLLQYSMSYGAVL